MIHLLFVSDNSDRIVFLRVDCLTLEPQRQPHEGFIRTKHWHGLSQAQSRIMIQGSSDLYRGHKNFHVTPVFNSRSHPGHYSASESHYPAALQPSYYPPAAPTSPLYLKRLSRHMHSLTERLDWSRPAEDPSHGSPSHQHFGITGCTQIRPPFSHNAFQGMLGLREA